MERELKNFVTLVFLQEGHKPERIISPSLKVGGNLQTNASNGQTKVYMNGRELGRLELKMLKVRFKISKAENLRLFDLACHKHLGDKG